MNVRRFNLDSSPPIFRKVAPDFLTYKNAKTGRKYSGNIDFVSKPLPHSSFDRQIILSTAECSFISPFVWTEAICFPSSNHFKNCMQTDLDSLQGNHLSIRTVADANHLNEFRTTECSFTSPNHVVSRNTET